MAKALGLTVTVEGVETEAQLAHLKGLGCEHAQGYLFSKPLDAAAVADYMRSGSAGAEDEPLKLSEAM